MCETSKQQFLDVEQGLDRHDQQFGINGICMILALNKLRIYFSSGIAASCMFR